MPRLRASDLTRLSRSAKGRSATLAPYRPSRTKGHVPIPTFMAAPMLRGVKTYPNRRRHRSVRQARMEASARRSHGAKQRRRDRNGRFA